MGIVNIVVNPSDVPTNDKEREQKTDSVDAGKLAHSLRKKELTGIYTHRLETLQDRSLLRVRKGLVNDMTRIKNRIKGMLYYYGVPYPAEYSQGKGHWSRRFSDWLKKEVLEGNAVGKEACSLLLEEYEGKKELLLKSTRMIRELSKQDGYCENLKFIRSVPGIGCLTGMYFLVNIEDIERFPSRDRFAGYIGLKPTRHQSDSKDPKGHLTNRSQKELRALLIESAWVAARKDSALT